MPPAIFIPETLQAWLMVAELVQDVVKYATSDVPGIATVVPTPQAPSLVAQFETLEILPPAEPIQYLLAAKIGRGKIKQNKRKTTNIKNFLHHKNRYTYT